jgi:PhoPQ-activated pathogenicity-related protein
MEGSLRRGKIVRRPHDWLGIAAALVCTPAFAQVRAPEPAAALAAYVNKADESFSWRVQRRYRRSDAEILALQLVSQTWQGIPWKHQLFVVRPRRVTDDAHGVLIIGGGRWRDEYATATAEAALPEGAELFVAIARRLRAPVVVLGQVPFQPLFDLSEDRLIAYTFERYLATGDTEWPLLLPMVKSVVRAFDASSGASEREWGAPLERFTVLGGSKRGWTAWLVASIDERVTALAPIVIDALNMERHFPHQTEVWGSPSEEIRPYTDLGLDVVLGSKQGADLRAIVDPFSYRASIRQPKLVMLATNDTYFPVDSANLYFDELREPRYLLYLPNEPHSIRHYGPVVRSLRALHAAAAGGPPLPRVAWELDWGDAAVALCVRSEPKARQWRVWKAVSPERDLRGAQWQVVAESRRAPARFDLARPQTGYVAFFGEATFGGGPRSFPLSTNLAVLAAPSERSYGTTPRGHAGVCDAVGAMPLPVP